ncbi:MAG: winged helix-turn-helix transcriptional regulator [Theionarchaea archaeon]|nr:winged helix-turn-helix transcriptional regulator [Theionarchaea archaeon]MBU7001160.1 winged helix-turn-helix transcriptional regulator [Theionarchaea archaeon]MBU7019939.1 winged helix-turn-helix transcriptional regulator [Theionarchaea archaeon]MBU7034031.1 winged helix-turn-helix transcriptional regulator [Theionarchaea archaeon]MBU7039566.1 winged helix-turn-helix transcriptional regulator [Theionarchaea archaeon]
MNMTTTDIKALPYEIKRNPTALLILLYLAEKEGSNSICFIANEIGFTEAAVSKGVEKLLKCDLVEKSYGKGDLGKRKTFIRLKK